MHVVRLDSLAGSQPPLTQASYILYGSELSYFSGKARSFLRKKGVGLELRSTSHPGFRPAVAAIGAAFQPILESPSGEYVQDTTEIIDFIEARHPERSVYPDSGCQRLVALLFELYGDEGMLKPAMHYRWNFPDANDPFLLQEFSRAISASDVPIPDGPDPACPGRERSLAVAAAMRGGIVPALGVTAASVAVIERAYEELLDLLEAHFRAQPYLLGGRPSVGDFGMLGPLYAHLGRDPYPADLMKRRAPMLYRWVERMNVADAALAEFPDMAEEFLGADAVPPTLVPILEVMARDFAPELLGIVRSVDSWLDAHPEVKAGDAVPGTTGAMGTAGPFGKHSVNLRGTALEIAVRHYSLWMLQRVQAHYAGLAGATRERADALLEATGLGPLMTARPRLGIERRNHVEYFV